MKTTGHILAVLSLFAIAGCGGVPEEADERMLVRRPLGFAVDVPPEWAVKDLNGDVVLEIRPPIEEADDADATGPVVVLQVMAIPRGEIDTLGTWADAMIDETHRQHPNVEVVERRAVTTAAGTEALEVVLEHRRGLVLMRQRMWLVLTGVRAYGFSATGPAESLEGRAKAVDTWLDSIVVW